MKESVKKYDVAFSFLHQDEKLALDLYSILTKSLSCFIYTEEQKRISGTDGEESFSSVFIDETRVVVILYRAEWGNTKWTRIEETAIRNRGFDEGYDFAILVPIEENVQPPKWFPKNRIWVGITRWGIKSAAAVIEARAQEFGSEIKIKSLGDKIAAREQEILRAKKINDILKGKEGIQLGKKQFQDLLNLALEEIKAISTRIENWRIRIRDNKYHGKDFISYGHQLTIEYYPASPSHYIYLVLFDGVFVDDISCHQLVTPKRLFESRLVFDINEFEQFGWCQKDSRSDFRQNSEIIEDWLGRFFEHAGRNKSKE